MTTAEKRAVSVVSAIKALLSDSARAHISDAQFEEMAIVVREAICDELNAAADLVEQVARKLRETAQESELGL
jgi:hypothetical protein